MKGIAMNKLIKELERLNKGNKTAQDIIEQLKKGK